MNHSPYLLFHQTPEQLRRSEARGGRAYARNRRDRLHNQPVVLRPTSTPTYPPLQTTAEAIAQLDARFPWLRGAERRDVGGAIRP